MYVVRVVCTKDVLVLHIFTHGESLQKQMLLLMSGNTREVKGKRVNLPTSLILKITPPTVFSPIMLPRPVRLINCP